MPPPTPSEHVVALIGRLSEIGNASFEADLRLALFELGQDSTRLNRLQAWADKHRLHWFLSPLRTHDHHDIRRVLDEHEDDGRL